MKTSEIIELIQVLENTDYRYIAINKEGTSILLSKDKVNEGSEKQISTLKEDKVEKVEETKVAVKESIEEINEQPQASIKDENCFIVKSPIVGTFYSSSSPEAEPFVKRGNVVKKGDVICIIEAMKLMNEIESEVDGEIVDILIENEAVVQYGQPLFKIKANS